MNCEKYRDPLTEAAVAAPADATPGAVRDAALRAHLDACAACRAELDRLRTLTSAIDTSLAQIASADPSPTFAACVRARLSEEADRRASRWRAWTPALAGALTAAVLIAWLATRSTPSRQGAPPDIAKQPPSAPVTPDHGPQPNPVPRVPDEAPSKVNEVAQHIPRHTYPRSAAARSQRSLPEILVTGDEWRQVAKLYALSQKGQVDARALAPPDPTPLEEKFRPLAIAKLEIQPIGNTAPDTQRQ